MPSNIRKADTKKLSQEVKEDKKWTLSDWLAIVNIVVTLILGLGLTAYLHFNGQKFQKQMLELQNELQFVDIIVSHDDRSFTYTNQGASTAKNLRIVFCYANVNDEWKDVVKDTGFFKVIAENSAMDFTVTDFEDGCDDWGENPIGRKLVTLESLPPQESIRLALIPRSNSTSIREYQGTAYIQTKGETEPGQSQSSANGLFSGFLAHELAIAQFRTNVSCDNCRNAIGTDAIVSAPPLETSTISYSQMIADANNSVIDFSVTYHSPDGLTESAHKNILYLRVIDTEPFLQEIDKKEFDSGLP